MRLNKDENTIKREFRIRQTRQSVAIAAALFMVLLAAVFYKRPDLFGTFSKPALFAMQAVIIAAFLAFTNHNWRCPCCGKFLRSDINRRHCRSCAARLQ